eukprot:scaffold8341_cov66-Cyclotella_meneghiniana.AAC.6
MTGSHTFCAPGQLTNRLCATAFTALVSCQLFGCAFTFGSVTCIPVFYTSDLSPYTLSPGESECVDHVIGMEVRPFPGRLQRKFSTFGTIGDSLHLMQEAWPELEHVFCVHGPSIPVAPQSCQHHIAGPRFPLRLLRTHPVDLLVIECGDWQLPRPSLNGMRWEQAVQMLNVSSRPLLVIEVWPANALLWDLGPSGKGCRTRWDQLGYTTHMKVVDSQHVGGAIVQPRALIVRSRLPRWSWAPYSFLSTPRPMQNLLIPKGLRPKRSHREPPQDLWRLP